MTTGAAAVAKRENAPVSRQVADFVMHARPWIDIPYSLPHVEVKFLQQCVKIDGWFRSLPHAVRLSLIASIPSLSILSIIFLFLISIFFFFIFILPIILIIFLIFLPLLLRLLPLKSFRPSHKATSVGCEVRFDVTLGLLVETLGPTALRSAW
ncbi:hypothetical protein B0I35DRAFT_404775 [Stachybotrys elegans]|uniref:Uncharacterized protein n=1 Tax=Stachybotrys elegans TaxID=80388 RepID=A0A8K0T936_9HYPO|nr:hypothetical protein B0I35DRAFT_404775 [Stachybotrys elegans]